MRKRIYIEIPGKCKMNCELCPTPQSDYTIDRRFYMDLFKDARRAGFNWIGFCGVDPINQVGIFEIITDSLNEGFEVRIYGSPFLKNRLPHNEKVSWNLQYTIILTDEMLCYASSEIIENVLDIVKNNPSIEIAIKNAVLKHDSSLVRKACEQNDIKFYNANWWFQYWNDEYGRIIHVTEQMQSRGSTRRKGDDAVCAASINKVFIDYQHNIRACYMAKKGVANLDRVMLSDCMTNDEMWGEWRTIRIKDMTWCLKCIGLHTCHICPAQKIEL